MSITVEGKPLQRVRGRRPPLPGVQKPSAADVASMIRVDHAGEYGALRIYGGQLAILERKAGAEAGSEALRAMAATEHVHFSGFERLRRERAVRPTLLEPVWRVAGYLLGAATARMGEKAAMACTVAVEDVIDWHYRRQMQRLGETDAELKTAIQSYHADECAHRDEALALGAEQAPAYRLLTAAIGLCCRAAIHLSERL